MKRVENVWGVGFVVGRARRGDSREGRVGDSGEGVDAGSDSVLVGESCGGSWVEGAGGCLAGALYCRPFRLVGSDGCLGRLRLWFWFLSELLL